MEDLAITLQYSQLHNRGMIFKWLQCKKRSKNKIFQMADFLYLLGNEPPVSPWVLSSEFCLCFRLAIQ